MHPRSPGPLPNPPLSYLACHAHTEPQPQPVPGQRRFFGQKAPLSGLSPVGGSLPGSLPSPFPDPPPRIPNPLSSQLDLSTPLPLPTFPAQARLQTSPHDRLYDEGRSSTRPSWTFSSDSSLLPLASSPRSRERQVRVSQFLFVMTTQARRLFKFFYKILLFFIRKSPLLPLANSCVRNPMRDALRPPSTAIRKRIISICSLPVNAAFGQFFQLLWSIHPAYAMLALTAYLLLGGIGWWYNKRWKEQEEAAEAERTSV